jgi:hypothetical protein
MESGSFTSTLQLPQPLVKRHSTTNVSSENESSVTKMPAGFPQTDELTLAHDENWWMRRITIRFWQIRRPSR